MASNKPIIKVSTPKSKRFDGKIDIYTSNPKGEHKSIHITTNTNDKTIHIIDNTNGKTEHTDAKCFLTSACMKYFQENFDDNSHELTTLRWFRDNFVSLEDKEHYYEVAPSIVEAINNEKYVDLIYKYIYDNVVNYCVKKIEDGKYEEAYSRYKISILSFEERYLDKTLGNKLIKSVN